jgi:hypothetical protein
VFHQDLLNKLFATISDLGILRKLIIVLLRKKIPFVVLCITKFQSDLLNQKFLLRIDCKSAKYILKKDVENIASKQIFARWQAILSAFDFDIEYIKGSENSIPDFLTREFLQCHNGA